MTACRSSAGRGQLRPESRSRRNTVEQIIETFVPVQILDDPEPMEVEQLADILRILDMSSNFVQGIDLRKISQDSIPQRVAVRAPQLVAQLVDVPLPQVVTLARGKDAAGRVWFQLKARRGIYWWLSGTAHPVAPFGGVHRQPWAVYKY